MANITYLSNQAGFPVDDNPGGDTPTGTVEWHDSLYYNFYYGWTSAAQTEYSWDQRGFNQLLNSNRLVFNRDFRFAGTSYYYTWAQRAYDVYNLDAEFEASQNAAILAPWTVHQPTTTAWAHQGHDKLIYGSGGTYGSNKAKILAVDVDTGLYFSSMTAAQIGAITGATAYEVEAYSYDKHVVSPDGTKIFAQMPTRVGSDLHQRFYQIDLNSAGEFTGLTLMSGVGRAALSSPNSLLGCTNNRVLMVTDSIGSSADYVFIRDIADLSLVSTVTLPGGLNFYQPNRGQAGTITKGNFIYFPSFVGTGRSAAQAIGLQLIKLNMTTGSIVGMWDISNPPIESGFTSVYEPTAEPENQGINGVAFTPDGTLYLSFSNDLENVGLAPWSSTSHIRNRIFRCTLS